MDDTIIAAAQHAFSSRLRGSSDVSDNTKNAQAIARTWRDTVHKLDPKRFQFDVLVAAGMGQKIDIVDVEAGCAYTFKVSGKNAAGDFYKDIVKVIVWNEKKEKKLSRLVYITEEEDGRRALDAPVPLAYIAYLTARGLKVRVDYVRLN